MGASGIKGFNMEIKTKHKTKGELNYTKFNARKLAQRTKLIIYKRTKAGLDINSKKFVPYTLPYKEWKQKHTGYSGHPNLTLSGKMLQNLRIKSGGKKKAVLGFTGSQAIIAAANNKLRRFWGITKEDLKKLLQRMFK
jgi:hypothetical protein